MIWERLKKYFQITYMTYMYIFQNTRLHQNRLRCGCMFIYCIYWCWWCWWWGWEKSRKRVFDRCFNWCFESAAPLRMIREPSSSSSNTNGRRMVWPHFATLKAAGWNLLQEPRCADNADVPTLVGAPVWGSTRELLWKLCRSERGKRVNTWWKHHAFFGLDRKGQWIRWF